MKNEMSHLPKTPDALDELLLGADDYLPDNGFTARVLTALPAKRTHSWRRFGVLTGAMVIGTVLVAGQLPAAITLLNTLPKHWSALQWQPLVALVPLLAALASLGWVAFVVTTEEE